MGELVELTHKRFLSWSQIKPQFTGKSVAIVGSGPGVLSNEPDFVDSHDVVVRVNNYRLGRQAGHRTDVFYSFFGASIRKASSELIEDGVRLCMCKCPCAKPIKSAWHEECGKTNGIDFRSIYRRRADWWFSDVYIPTIDSFMDKFLILSGHVPTTGFAAILDVLSFKPKLIYLTGFDFFRSGLHNVNEPWREKNMDDPIGHVPERELAWLSDRWHLLPVFGDEVLRRALLENKA